MQKMRRSVQMFREVIRMYANVKRQYKFQSFQSEKTVMHALVRSAYRVEITSHTHTNTPIIDE